MPRDLFVSDEPSTASRSRRSSLLVASAVTHAALAIALLLVTILMPDVLPRPHAAGLDWDPTVGVVSIADVPLPPTAPLVRPKESAPSLPDAAPVAAPDGIAPEPETPHVPVPRVGEVDGTTFGRELTVAEPAPPTPPPAPPAPKQPVRVFAGVEPPRKIQDVPPAYPVLARSTGVQGIVIIEATIDASGTVVDTKILRSVPMLDQAATDAVRQWKYAPAHLNGEPIAVLITVTVNFVLGAR